MKKKWLGLLTAAFALTAAFGFAACDDKESGKGDSGKGDSDLIKNESVGLNFLLLEDGKSYEVVGIGTCKDYDLIIPNEYNGFPITSIGESAFLNCDDLTSVTIPNSVTSIGNGAFANCYSLTSVYYTGDIAGWCSIDFEVNTEPFANPLCFAEKFYIEDMLITDLVIPDNVFSIGTGAFSGYESLIRVVIPNSVTSIGDYAFYSCNKLVEVYNKSSLEITVGSEENGYVGCYALNVYTPTSGASKLSTDANGYIIYTDGDDKILVGYTGNETVLTLLSGITAIHGFAFVGCGNLTSVTIGNGVTTIGNFAFFNRKSLTSVVIGNEVTSIGYAAFFDCDGLMRVKIGDNVTSIGNSAFCNCEGLTSVTISDNVTTIGAAAFVWCSNLTSITFEGTVAEWEAIGYDDWKDVPAEKVICKDGEVSI